MPKKKEKKTARRYLSIVEFNNTPSFGGMLFIAKEEGGKKDERNVAAISIGFGRVSVEVNSSKLDDSSTHQLVYMSESDFGVVEEITQAFCETWRAQLEIIKMSPNQEIIIYLDKE